VISERAQISMLVLALLVAGFAGLLIYSGFSFDKSVLSFDGTTITEKLFMTPNSDYRNLYRYFNTPIDSNLGEGYIKISDVECSFGNSYYKDYDGKLFTQSDTSLFSMTENNEYGCSLGDNYGYVHGSDYWMSSQYELYPSALFSDNGKKYIKFVAYSSGKHPLLIKGENFIVPDGVIARDVYLPSEDVVIYVPYSVQDSVPVLSAVSFNYPILDIVVVLLPALLTLLIWLFFGKENLVEDVPDYFSQIPDEKRKPWQVAAFFDPPFSDISPNMFAATLLDFYNRNIIDLKSINDKTYVKILKVDGLDEIESEIMGMLETIQKHSSKENINQGYFKITENAFERAFSPLRNVELQSQSILLSKDVKSKSKEYISKIGIVLVSTLLFISFLVAVHLFTGWMFVIGAVITLSACALIARSSLFSKYKGEFFREYQKWQGFKKYLRSLPSIKSSPPQATVLWERYLVYGTALGVSEKVLKALQSWKIINTKDYGFYHGAIITTTTMSGFSAAAPRGGAGGGIGGGGGMGGGGVGGR